MHTLSHAPSRSHTLHSHTYTQTRHPRRRREGPREEDPQGLPEGRGGEAPTSGAGAAAQGARGPVRIGRVCMCLYTTTYTTP